MSWGYKGEVDCRPGGKHKRRNRFMARTKRVYATHELAFRAAERLALDILCNVSCDLWIGSYTVTVDEEES